MKFNSRVYVAGSGGMVGSAIVRNFKREGDIRTLLLFLVLNVIFAIETP